MPRGIAVLSMLMAVVAAMTLTGPATAKMFVEAELGGKWISADWGDMYSELDGNVLGLGVTLGGTIGYMVTPKLGLVAHAELGRHGPPDDVTVTVWDWDSDGPRTYPATLTGTGWSLDCTLGGRVYPMGGARARGSSRTQDWVSASEVRSGVAPTSCGIARSTSEAQTRGPFPFSWRLMPAAT